MPIRIRTCVASRKQLPDTQLLRVVADPDDPGRVIADPARCLPGRGAWITPTLEALELAEQRRAYLSSDSHQDPHVDRKTEH